jgi:hypothetical protein
LLHVQLSFSHRTLLSLFSQVVHFNSKERLKSADAGPMYLLPQFCVLEGLPEELRGSERLKDERKKHAWNSPADIHRQNDRLLRTVSEEIGKSMGSMNMTIATAPLEIEASVLAPPKVCVDQVGV